MPTRSDSRKGKDVVQHCKSLCEDPLRPFATVDALSAADVEGLSAATLHRYAVLVISHHCCHEHLYGRTCDDFAAATAFFVKPEGSFPRVSCDVLQHSKAYLLCFNPLLCQDDDLIAKKYSFFDYNANEALHLSDGEFDQLRVLLNGITSEQHHDIDKDSSDIMAHHVMLVLDYCRRFYTRQFIVRADSNRLAIDALHAIIKAHYSDCRCCSCPTTPPKTPDVARQMKMSEQYLEDLVKHETGLTVAQHVNLQRFDMARDMLQHTDMSTAVIAHRLGFKSSKCLDGIFQKTMGFSAKQCRSVS